MISVSRDPRHLARLHCTFGLSWLTWAWETCNILLILVVCGCVSVILASLNKALTHRPRFPTLTFYNTASLFLPALAHSHPYTRRISPFKSRSGSLSPQVSSNYGVACLGPACAVLLPVGSMRNDELGPD